LINIFQAIDTEHVTPIVRAPWNDFVTMKRILDAGAYGVLVPYVNNSAAAAAAVAACKHPLCSRPS
jgi:2-dehydro-3-deoxyglucarate aldolase/4-hydroxy-2-oxoheptanedioate aldolase